MKFPLPTFTSVACFLCLSEHVLSAPHPRPRPKPLHEVRVDLIDHIFQIPIQTLNAVGNLLKNVHSAKRNYLSVNIHVDKPDPAHPLPFINIHVERPDDRPAKPTYPASKPDKPDSYPAKPDSYPAKPDSPAGFPDYQPDYNPVLASTSARPVSVGVNIQQGPKPGTGDNEVLELSPSTSGGIDPGFTDSQDPSTETKFQGAPVNKPVTASPYKPSEPAFDRVSPAPAVQPPYTRPVVAQPLSLDSGLSFDKPSNREKNFKEYVQRKLAEKNLQDNRISHSF